MPPEIAKAVGRLASGLYIVTAAQANARSAMVASWVSQARGRARARPSSPLRAACAGVRPCTWEKHTRTHTQLHTQ